MKPRTALKPIGRVTTLALLALPAAIASTRVETVQLRPTSAESRTVLTQPAAKRIELSHPLATGAGARLTRGTTAQVRGARPVVSNAQVRARRNIPATAAPSGYGRYCSVSYASGGWAFATLSGSDSDPCADLLRSTPGGTIERAGLWATQGMNNVLWNCQQGLGIYAAQGSAATAFAYEDATSKKKTHCVFVVAPQRLPVFGLPYGKTESAQNHPSDDVSLPTVFNFNIYREDWDATEFGQVQEADTNRGIDRLGRGRNVRESAYDWGMPDGKPIVSVARGRVLAARDRDVTAFGCPSPQKEIYVLHRIGSGEYAEDFVSYYAHLSEFSVQTGDTVNRGQELGKAGTTGCSSGDHLHFSVSRLSNLSGHRFHDFRLQDTGYGVNGIRGIIDPFGWAAPQHIDPWAWKYLNGKSYADDYEGLIQVQSPGAFSIRLWREGEAPPFQ